jgi:hypothetical protein
VPSFPYFPSGIFFLSFFFFWWDLDLNLGICACKAGALPLEPYLKSWHFLSFVLLALVAEGHWCLEALVSVPRAVWPSARFCWIQQTKVPWVNISLGSSEIEREQDLRSPDTLLGNGFSEVMADLVEGLSPC